MGYLITLCAALLFAFSAQAATYSTKEKAGGCPKKLAHVADEDVHVRAGIGKDGWAVAPADIAPSPFPLGSFDNIPIGLNIPLGAYASGVSGVDLSETHIGIGQFSVKKEGELRFNGQAFSVQPYDEKPECE